MATPKLLPEAERAAVTRIYSRREIENAFLEAFERSGGVDRLVLWASQNRNYKDFLNFLVKFAPKDPVQEGEGGVILEYRSLVPSSTLNRQVAHKIKHDQPVEDAVIVDDDRPMGVPQ